MVNKKFNNVLNKKDFLLYLLNRNSFITITPMIIISLIVALIYAIRLDGYQNNDLAFALPIIIFILVYMKIYTAINKVSLNNVVDISIDENNYSEISEEKTTSLELDKFNSYYENKNYFYLYVDKINALILPKREFNDSETEEIRKHFSNKLKRKTFLNLRNIINFVVFVGLLYITILLILLTI